MGMNPMQLVGMLMSNPKQIISKALGSNPMAGNLIGMVDKSDTKGIEQMARNLAKEKGQDPDKLYNEIKSRLGM